MENSILTVSVLDSTLTNLVDWEKFAIHLPKMDMQEVEEIKKEKHKLADQKMELYNRWLRRCTSPSWGDVQRALQTAKENTLAKKIEEEYINISSSSFYTSDSYSTPPRRKQHNSGSIKRHLFPNERRSRTKMREHDTSGTNSSSSSTTLTGTSTATSITPTRGNQYTIEEMSIENTQLHYSREEVKDLEASLRQEISAHSQTKMQNVTLNRKRRRIFCELQNTAEAAQASLVKVKREKHDVEEKYRNLEYDNEQLSAEKSQLISKLEKAEAEAIKVAKERDKVEDRCKVLENEDEQLCEYVSMRDEALSKSKEEYKRLSTTCYALTISTGRLTTENQRLRNTQTTLRQQLNDLTSTVNTQRQQEIQLLQHMTTQLL